MARRPSAPFSVTRKGNTSPAKGREGAGAGPPAARRRAPRRRRTQRSLYRPMSMPPARSTCSRRPWKAEPRHAGASSGRAGSLLTGLGFHDPKEGPDDPGIELAPGALPEDPGGGAVAQGLPVGAIGGHGIVGVGPPHDAGQDRNGLPAQPLGVATAIVMLLVVADDGPDRLEEVHLADDVLPNERGGPDGRPLLGVQRAVPVV